MLPEQQQRILGYFIEEAKDHLNTIEQGLLNLQSTLNDPEMINEVFRAAHSIKGGAAMLGLSSIQRTAHRLEDCFKLLKEHPVQVDQKLETLFLGVSDTLKALLENLQGPFGLSEETANTLMSEAEPVFKWLHEHLETLLRQEPSDMANSGRALAKTSSNTTVQLSAQSSTNIENQQDLQNQVIQILREMLQLFKQPATPITRKSLQDCCEQLAKLGRESNWSNWCNLCQAAGSAISNPDNSYLALAKIVITEIRQSLELLLAGREAEIAINQQLEALICVAEDIELLTIPLDLEAESTNVTPDPSATTQISQDTAVLDTTSHQLTLLSAEPQDTITSLSELSDSIAEASDEHKTLPIYAGINVHGPEVGIAELTELDELFKDEAPELDGTWEEEEIIDTSGGKGFAEDLTFNLSEQTNNEFEFLFADSNSHDKSPTTHAQEELSLMHLFGEFLGDEDSEVFSQDKTGITLASDPEKITTVNVNEVQDQVGNLLDIVIDSSEVINVKRSEDEINNLFDLVLDEQEGLINRDELQVEDEIVVDAQLTLQQESSFDNLFSAAPEAEQLEKIADELDIESEKGSAHNEELSFFEELFTEDKTDLVLSEDNTTFGSLADELPLTTVEFSPEDGFPEFWQQEFELEHKRIFEAESEQDAARELEEFLLLAASGDDIFGDSEQLISSVTDDPESSLDFDFQSEEHLNLIFSAETEPGDLFAELLPTNQNEISSQELSSFSQQPEALELMPEFTDSALSNEIIEEDITDTHLQANYSLSTENIFNEVGLDSIEDSLAIPSADVIDEILAAEGLLDINFFEDTETLEFQRQSEPANIGVDEQGINHFNDSFLTAETVWQVDNEQNHLETWQNVDLENITKTATRWQDDQATSDILPPEELEKVISYLRDLTQMQVTNASEVISEVVEDGEILQEESPPLDQAFLLSDFAELDELLKQDTAVLQSNMAAVPETQIASLEELLSTEPNQVTLEVGNHSTPNTTSSVVVPNDIEDGFKELEQMLVGHGKASLPAHPPNPRSPRFEQLMKVPVKHLDDLSNLVGELVVNRNTLEQDQERLRQSLDNLLNQVQQLSDVGARMQELYERSLLEASLLASRRSGHFSSFSDTDRGFSELEMDRFTPFHTLSQEMIELIVRVRESASDIDFVTEETERVARQFRQVTTQLQEGITRARMEPFAEVTTPLERGVRESAIKYGKQAQLVIEGRDTLIDKMILLHLKDPLTHLLNNAIAHGIEPAEVRQAANKPPVGVITVRAFHQGNQTVISVRDDGAGIDPERVKAKALKKGLLTQEQAKTLSRHDIYDLLFQPGFSTKEQEDELAGRGVGLDVVRTRISEIRGIVNVDSTLGRGTSFTIRLPLTLSICKALCCVSDKARIAFPMDSVEDTLDIPVKNIVQGAQGQKFIPWRDTMLPFRPLKEVLTYNRHLSRGSVYGGNRDDDMVSVVVVRSANALIALQVDQVLSEQEIVIKQFEGPAPKPVGVAGATILGDGRIMPIADVLEILDIFQGRAAKQRGVSLWEQKGTPIPQETSAVKIDPTVLIIDDSITVRELLSLTFSKAGYRVEQARDGQEAWDKLRSGLPCDIVFCDIEMPRCDGLELLSRIQKDSNLNHLPIAMLTSRGADKHRQMAIQLGARGYFTKPYLEEALLEAASRMLKGENLVSTNNNF